MLKHKLIPRPAALALAMALSQAGLAVAQQPAGPVERMPIPAGRIVGRVLDAQSGEGLSSVTVQVVGTGVGAITGINGHFAMANVPSGEVTLRVSSIGYATKTVTAVAVAPGGVVEQNIALEAEAVALSAIEVTAAAERGSVNRALDQQRTATNIVNAVTAEQITRSPDSDAAQAVQRVSGVTVQDGKFVVVRGLGERYTTTSLNGTRLPSPEPEKKLVPLDLFPSALLETITTSKTFTPDQPGDFSGAQVDIRMRDFPTQRTSSLSTTFGWNGAATGKSVLSAPGTGSEWIGFAAGARKVPANLAAAGRFTGNVTQADMNSFVNGFRNVWTPGAGNGAPNGSAAFSMGDNGQLFGRPFGYVLSGTYSYGQEIRSNEVRAIAQPSQSGGTEEVDHFTGTTGRTSVLWGGVFNASTLIGSKTRLALNTTYNRSADNEARREAGVSEQFGLPLDVTRLRYVERSVASAQLVGEHELAAGHRLDWAVTGSQVTRDEPDRSEFVYATQRDPVTGQAVAREWFASASEGAVRTFADLTERAIDTKADYRVNIGTSRSYAKVGGLFRYTNRDTHTNAYSITAPTLDITNRRLSPEEIFDGRFSQPGQSYFQVAPMSQGGSYQVDDLLFAGYALMDFGLTDRIRAIAGARVERSQVDLLAVSTLGTAAPAKPTFTDVLPSLAVNIALTDRMNLRLSASQTLSRPEYRELAEVMYRDVIGGENVRGNPDLVRSLIRNFDARWELYPSSGEALSLALFAKDFDHPIERVYLGNSGSGKLATYANAVGAVNYGVEVEARKRLGFLSESLENLTGFINGTLMKSEIEIGDAAGASKTNDKRPMVGQSPYVFNAGLTYSSASGSRSVTALYNVFGKRIQSAAVVPLPDVYEQPRSQLDLAMRFPLMSNVSAKLDLKNLLDKPYELRQGTVIREYYRAGRVISAGVSWRP